MNKFRIKHVKSAELLHIGSTYHLMHAYPDALGTGDVLEADTVITRCMDEGGLVHG
ncbi:hypothetical protein [Paraburkholderia dinghuensis]|uniref:hypothetical protein n=1 Tax=Paraburkholderia dinghuensis TaxID=2305225 RepID=UPI0016250ABF|nr:hypothetical protein [Paraburkholderia dinghuensis]